MDTPTYFRVSQKKRPEFRLISFTIRLCFTAHIYCYVMHLSYIFYVRKYFSLLQLLNPKIWTRFWVIFCTCKEINFIIILIFGDKTICALNSLFLSVSFSFNVFFHQPYYKINKKINYSNTFFKKNFAFWRRF